MAGIGSCCYAICAIVVVVVSILLFLIGLVLAAVGGILLWGTAIINQYVGPMLTGLLKGVAIDNFKIDADTMINGLIEFLSPLAVGLFVAGIILVILGFCGMFGPCCKNKCLLVVFVIVAAVILLAEMVLLILFMTKKDEYVTSSGEYLKGVIKDQYVGIKATNFVSLLINAVQALLGCCGVSGGTDYANATKWNRSFSYKQDGNSVNITLKYPVTCCKMKNFEPVSVNCTWDPTPENSNYNQGCLQYMSSAADEYGVFVGGGLGALFGLEIILTVFGALMLFHAISAGNKVDAAKY